MPSGFKKPGDRVGAILRVDAENKVLRHFGPGFYLGDRIPHDAAGWLAEGLKEHGVPNPAIQLDCGEIVFGCECWWSRVEQFEKILKQYEIMDFEIIMIRPSEMREQHRLEEKSEEQENGNKREAKTAKPDQGS